MCKNERGGPELSRLSLQPVFTSIPEEARASTWQLRVVPRVCSNFVHVAPFGAMVARGLVLPARYACLEVCVVSPHYIPDPVPIRVRVGWVGFLQIFTT